MCFRVQLSFHRLTMGKVKVGLYYTPANYVCGGYTVFTLSVHPWRFGILAHLSRRLSRWAYSIPMVRPSVVVVVVRPSVVHTCKLEYLWRQVVNRDQILYVASLGWGKGCIRFYGRLDQNSGFHGNRKPPLTYNGENGVSTFSRLFLTRFLYCRLRGHV